jgi:hypothetical protein
MKLSQAHSQVSHPQWALRRCLFSAWMLALASVILLSLPVTAQPAKVTETEFKAGLLVKFTQYTTWPATVFASSNAPIVIGVLGTDTLGKDLDREADGIAGKRRVEVRRVTTPEEAGQCHAVFISKAESRNEDDWLRALRDKPILTVGESGQTIENGAVIRLLPRGKGGRLFEVSRSAMERAGLKISADMLRYADIVPDRPSLHH